FALAVPLFPIGNVSLGLALLWAGLALGWLALAAREPRSGLLFAAGPLLAPLAALGFLPLLAAHTVRSPARRFAYVFAAVLAAGRRAGRRGRADRRDGVAHVRGGRGESPELGIPGKGEEPRHVVPPVDRAARRGPHRRRLRPRLPHARPAGRAGAEAHEGDGR